MSRPPTSSSPSSGAGPAEPPARKGSGVPGSRALAWALVGLAALRRRGDHAAARCARTDPHRRPARAGQAEAPIQIPPRGWWQVTRRAFKESSADNISILAGGIAYFGFIAIFPALIAGISLYGLVADPATMIAQQGEGLLSALPQEAQSLIRDQLNGIASGGGGALSSSLVDRLEVELHGICLPIWSGCARRVAARTSRTISSGLSDWGAWPASKSG